MTKTINKSVEEIKEIFAPRIKGHRKNSEDAMPGWGLDAMCRADELCEIFKNITGESFDENEI